MMLAMTGVEEEMVAVVVVSFTKAATASFFLVSPSFSLRNVVMLLITARERGRILPWLQLPRPLEKPEPLFLSGLVWCGTFFMVVYMTYI